MGFKLPATFMPSYWPYASCMIARQFLNGSTNHPLRAKADVGDASTVVSSFPADVPCRAWTLRPGGTRGISKRSGGGGSSARTPRSTTAAVFSSACRPHPRCVLCASPFAGPFAPLLKLVGKGPFAKNPRHCGACIGALMKEGPGGAEVPATFLFADVRGSTPLAEQLGATALHQLMERFYEMRAGRMPIRSGGR